MLPPLLELLAASRVVSLPLVTPFRGIDQREAMLFEGPAGWSEFSPFLEYGDAESAVWLSAALDFAYSEPPRLRRNSVHVNATLPSVPPNEVAAVLDRFGRCRTVKIKVAEPGQLLADDVARVAAVRDYLGPEGRIRVDANGAWNLDEAEHAVHALAPFDLEYIEQPCEGVEELAELRKRIKYMGIPVAADESIRKSTDPLAVARLGAADLIVVKVQPLGGIAAALAVIEEVGLPAVVSSALETAVGISMGLHLAAAMPSLDYDCGLATGALLAADITRSPLRPVEGELTVTRVVPEPSLLREHAAAPAREAWWRERLSRCYALLDGQRNDGQRSDGQESDG